MLFFITMASANCASITLKVSLYGETLKLCSTLRPTHNTSASPKTHLRMTGIMLYNTTSIVFETQFLWATWFVYCSAWLLPYMLAKGLSFDGVLLFRSALTDSLRHLKSISLYLPLSVSECRIKCWCKEAGYIDALWSYKGLNNRDTFH